MPLPPPADLVAKWERKLLRFPELIPPGKLESYIGFTHKVGEQVSAFYRQAPELAREFARRYKIGRRDKRALMLYAEGASQREMAAKVHRHHAHVRMLLRRFEAFCKSKGVSAAIAYRRRQRGKSAVRAGEV